MIAILALLLVRVAKVQYDSTLGKARWNMQELSIGKLWHTGMDLGAVAPLLQAC